MFSGIIEEIGTVKTIKNEINLSTLTLRAKQVVKGIKLGDSVCVNGVCLTVSKKLKGLLFFEMMKETLLKSTLGSLKDNANVNLERALKVNDRLNGHIVTGHVDCIAQVNAVKARENYLEIVIEKTRAISEYIVKKGSVSVDGVSLTIGEVKVNEFSVYIIPFTAKHTILGEKKKNDKVNIEVDVMARYMLNRKHVIDGKITIGKGGKWN